MSDKKKPRDLLLQTILTLSATIPTVGTSRKIIQNLHDHVKQERMPMQEMPRKQVMTCVDCIEQKREFIELGINCRAILNGQCDDYVQVGTPKEGMTSFSGFVDKSTYGGTYRILCTAKSCTIRE